MQVGAEVDPIQFEVVRNALVEATEEMAIALRRSAYSTNIKTRLDFSCAFFDRELQTVAQAFAQPSHLGSLAEQVPRVVRHYGEENLEQGDGILVNHSYMGGVHLNDITLITPVYWEDELFGYVASLAHHVDVGGGSPASVGAFREVYQEGVIIPPREARTARGDRPGRVPADTGPDPVKTRDGGRLSRTDRIEQHGCAPADGPGGADGAGCG